MRELKYCLIILLVGSILFVSCKKKEKKDKVCVINETDFSGSYKIESIKYKESPASPETDGTALFFEPCQLDNVTTFNNNHTYTYVDAGTACTPPGDDNGTWTLAGSNLTVDGAPAVVENFTCTNFSLSQTDVNVVGDRITITFKKQ